MTLMTEPKQKIGISLRIVEAPNYEEDNTIEKTATNSE